MESLVITAAGKVADFAKRNPWLVVAVIAAWLLWNWLLTWSFAKFIIEPIAAACEWAWRVYYDLRAKSPVLASGFVLALILLAPLPTIFLLLATNAGERSARQKLNASASTGG